MSRRGGGQFKVDLNRAEWQVIEIPLELLQREQVIDEIIFRGNLEGTFYVDDMRFVVANAPATATAVVEDETTLPQTPVLEQNYPNPFNSETQITFSLPRDAAVALELYNLTGQKVATLLEGTRSAGNHSLHWNGRDDTGKPLASGVYIYRLLAGETTITRKLLLLR